MAQVYGNAVVNIAATHATDGSAGLFIERSVVRASRHFVRTNTLETFELIDDKLHERCIEKILLSKRAWAFQ